MPTLIHAIEVRDATQFDKNVCRSASIVTANNAHHPSLHNSESTEAGIANNSHYNDNNNTINMPNLTSTDIITATAAAVSVAHKTALHNDITNTLSPILISIPTTTMLSSSSSSSSHTTGTAATMTSAPSTPNNNNNNLRSDIHNKLASSNRRLHTTDENNTNNLPSHNQITYQQQQHQQQKGLLSLASVPLWSVGGDTCHQDTTPRPSNSHQDPSYHLNAPRLHPDSHNPLTHICNPAATTTTDSFVGTTVLLSLHDEPMRGLKDDAPCELLAMNEAGTKNGMGTIANAKKDVNKGDSGMCTVGGNTNDTHTRRLSRDAMSPFSPLSLKINNNPTSADNINTDDKDDDSDGSRSTEEVCNAAGTKASGQLDPLRLMRWRVLMLLCIMQFGTEYCFDLPGSLGAGEGDTIQMYFSNNNQAVAHVGESSNTGNNNNNKASSNNNDISSHDSANKGQHAYSQLLLKWQSDGIPPISPSPSPSLLGDSIPTMATSPEEWALFSSSPLPRARKGHVQEVPPIMVADEHATRFGTFEVIEQPRENDRGGFLALGGEDVMENAGGAKEEGQKPAASNSKVYNNKMNQGLYSFYSYPNIFMTIIGGLLVDKYLGLRRTSVLVSSLVVFSNFMFTYGVYTRTYWIMAAARLLFGCAGETLFVAQGSYMIRWFAGTPFQSFAFGVAISFARCGGGATYIVSPFVAQHFGGVMASLLVACLISFISFLGTFTVSRIDRSHEANNMLPPSNIKVARESRRRVEERKRQHVLAATASSTSSATAAAAASAGISSTSIAVNSVLVDGSGGGGVKDGIARPTVLCINNREKEIEIEQQQKRNNKYSAASPSPPSSSSTSASASLSLSPPRSSSPCTNNKGGGLNLMRRPVELLACCSEENGNNQHRQQQHYSQPQDYSPDLAINTSSAHCLLTTANSSNTVEKKKEEEAVVSNNTDNGTMCGNYDCEEAGGVTTRDNECDREVVELEALDDEGGGGEGAECGDGVVMDTSSFPSPSSSSSQAQAAAVVVAGPPAFKLAYFRTLPPSLIFLAISAGFCYAAVFPFLGIAKPLFESVYGMDQTSASTTAGLFHIIASVMCPVMGAIVDRTGRSPLWLMASSLGNAFVTGAMSAYADSDSGPFFASAPRFLVFLMSTFYAMYVSSLWSFISLTVPASATGIAYGVITSTLNIGIATVPLITGTILDSHVPPTLSSSSSVSLSSGFATSATSSSSAMMGWESSTASSSLVTTNTALSLPPPPVIPASAVATSSVLPTPLGFSYALLVLMTVYVISFFCSFVLMIVDIKYNKGLMMISPEGRDAVKRLRDEELAALWGELEEAESERKARWETIGRNS